MCRIPVMCRARHHSAEQVALWRAGMRAPDPSGARSGPQRAPGSKPLCLNPAPARRVIRVAPLASGGACAPAFAAPSADSGGAGSGGAALTITSPMDIPGRGGRLGVRDGRCGHGAYRAHLATRVPRVHSPLAWQQGSLCLHSQWTNCGMRQDSVWRWQGQTRTQRSCCKRGVQPQGLAEPGLRGAAPSRGGYLRMGPAEAPAAREAPSAKAAGGALGSWAGRAIVYDLPARAAAAGSPGTPRHGYGFLPEAVGAALAAKQPYQGLGPYRGTAGGVDSEPKAGGARFCFAPAVRARSPVRPGNAAPEQAAGLWGRHDGRGAKRRMEARKLAAAAAGGVGPEEAATARWRRAFKRAWIREELHALQARAPPASALHMRARIAVAV